MGTGKVESAYCDIINVGRVDADQAQNGDAAHDGQNEKDAGDAIPLSQGSGDGVVAMISYLMCPDRAASLSCPTIPRLMPTAGPA